MTVSEALRSVLRFPPIETDRIDHTTPPDRRSP